MTESEFPKDREEASESLRIGPYCLLEKIDEGGLGEVWLAEQRKPVKLRVALKLIKRGMDTKNVLARFEAERQALALMTHPNIDFGVAKATVQKLTEMTLFAEQGQWARMASENPSVYAPEEGEKGKWSTSAGRKAVTLLRPVENVSWTACQRMLGHLDLMLPSEAQREYGTRAGITRSPWWSGEKKSLELSANLADAFHHGNSVTAAVPSASSQRTLALRTVAGPPQASATSFWAAAPRG